MSWDAHGHKTQGWHGSSDSSNYGWEMLFWYVPEVKKGANLFTNMWNFTLLGIVSNGGGWGGHDNHAPH